MPRKNKEKPHYRIWAESFYAYLQKELPDLHLDVTEYEEMTLIGIFPGNSYTYPNLEVFFEPEGIMVLTHNCFKFPYENPAMRKKLAKVIRTSFKTKISLSRWRR